METKCFCPLRRVIPNFDHAITDLCTGERRVINNPLDRHQKQQKNKRKAKRYHARNIVKIKSGRRSCTSARGFEARWDDDGLL